MRFPSGLQSAVAANSRGSVSVRTGWPGRSRRTTARVTAVDVGVRAPADLVHLLEDDLAAVGRVPRPCREVPLPRAEHDANLAGGDVDRLQRADPPAVRALDGPAVDDLLAVRRPVRVVQPAAGAAGSRAACARRCRRRRRPTGRRACRRSWRRRSARRPATSPDWSGGRRRGRATGRGPAGAVGADQRHLEALLGHPAWKRTHGAGRGVRRRTRCARRRRALLRLAPEHAASRVVVTTRAAPTTRARPRILGICMPVEQSRVAADFQCVSRRRSPAGGGLLRAVPTMLAHEPDVHRIAAAADPLPALDDPRHRSQVRRARGRLGAGGASPRCSPARSPRRSSSSVSSWPGPPATSKRRSGCPARWPPASRRSPMSA